MKRNITLLVLGIVALFMIPSAFAQPVTENEAREVATRFLSSQTGKALQKAAIQCTYIEEGETAPLFYIFNGCNSYVMVSGESSVPSILAFSTSHSFQKENIAPAMKMWMDSYRLQIEMAQKSASPQLNSRRTDTSSIIESVEPLLASHWGQGVAYNYLCPRDENGQNGRCVTGCVATAMAQLMYYFRWPESGIGQYNYTHETYGPISADFANSQYDYNKMCDQPSQINAAISLLTNHCGVAVDMVYGPRSSGMYNHKAAYAMRTHFKYLPETKYIFRDSNGMAHDSLCPQPYPLDWDSVIISYLKKEIPLYYAGWSIPWTDGHAFICDGYQKDNSGNCYFHFNFGWEGQSDGYFYTDNLHPGSYNFNVAQELIINAFPDTNSYIYPKVQPLTGNRTFTHRTGSFEDGSGPGKKCKPNMDYTWQISPDLDTLVQMKIETVCKLADGDTLFVTSPDKSFSSRYFTNIDTIFSITESVFSYDFRLVTSGQENNDGIHVSYEAIYPEFCTKLIPHTKTSGTISDGSGNCNYNNNASCESTIKVRNAGGFRIHFTEMETEKNSDFIRFYDMNDSSKLILSLSGQLENDSDFFLPSNFVFIQFETDDSNTYSGWSFDYTTSATGISENGNSSLHIYPNPAQDLICIEQEEPALCNITIFDNMGKTIKKTTSSDNMIVLSIANLSAGVYFIRIEQSDNIFMRKFIKK